MAGNERRWRSKAGTALAVEFQRALEQLAKAGDYARHLHRDPWDFAVEIASLTALGLTTSDLRWLLGMGYIEQARDVSRPSDSARKFQRCDNLTFTAKTCFVLTAAGAAILRDRPFLPGEGRGEGLFPCSQVPNGGMGDPVPRLRFGLVSDGLASAVRAMPPPPEMGCRASRPMPGRADREAIPRALAHAGDHSDRV